MTSNTLQIILLAGAAMTASVAPVRADVPPATVFSYQGELRDGATLASGTFDLEFALYADAAGATQVGSTLCFNDVALQSGRISQALDFGPVFNGGKLYLGVSVRADPTGTLTCGDSTGFVAVGPPQPVGNAAVALHASSAQEADSAATTPAAVTAVDSAKLGGNPPAYYANADNLTGVLSGAALGGTYPGALTLSNTTNVLAGDGSLLTNVTASLATTATLADSSTSATNTLLLGGASLADVTDLGHLVGALPNSQFANAYTGSIFGPVPTTTSFVNECHFNNTANTYGGNGTPLTGLKLANATAGALNPADLSGTYTNQLTFSSTSNQWSGNGQNLASLNASAFTGNGTIPAAQLPVQTFVATQKDWGVDGFSTSSTSYVDLPNTAQTFTSPISGTGVLKWNISGFTSGGAARFTVGVFVDNVLTGIEIPFGINNVSVHQYCFGTVVFPVSAGAHTIKMAVKTTGVVFNVDSNDSVSWTLLVVH